MSEVPSNSLVGFRRTFEQIVYLVSRALYTHAGDIIQLNVLRDRVLRFQIDATNVSYIVFKGIFEHKC